MTPSAEELLLIQRYADGLATADETARLQAALRADAGLRAVFLDYVHLDSALEALAAARPPAEESAPEVFPVRPVRRTWFAVAAVAAAVALAALAFFAWRPGAVRGVEIEVLATDSARLAGDRPGLAAGDRLTLESLVLESGSVRFRLGSGVTVDLRAPAAVELESPMRLRVRHGRLQAEAGPEALGFTVVTDAGEVVDLGTSFGVEADRHGESRVAVFSGQVKVRRGTAEQGNEFTALGEGEAVRFSAAAGLRRWQDVAVAADAAGLRERSATAVVGAVRDNLGDDVLHPFYGVVRGGLRPGALAFTDKPNPRWAPGPDDGLPEWLRGADLIRTYHQFRYQRHYELTLTLREAAAVFVLIDTRQPEPAWLASRFSDTGVRVAVGPWQQGMKTEGGTQVRADDLPYLTFAVWRTHAGPGDFKLGPPRDPGRNNLALMYGVAVKALRADSLP